MSQGGKAQVAPHRRGGGGPRYLERAAVYGYRLGAWIVARYAEEAAMGAGSGERVVELSMPMTRSPRMGGIESL